LYPNISSEGKCSLPEWGFVLCTNSIIGSARFHVLGFFAV
jgi:hypothetical protein